MLVACLLLLAVFAAGCAGPTATTTSSATASTVAAAPTTSTAAPDPSTTLAPTTTSAAPTTTTTAAPTTTTTVPAPVEPLAFDTARAMAHIKKLAADIGIRPGGSPAEDQAVAYTRDYLAGLGYDPAVTEVPLTNGKTSHNVVAVKQGASSLTVVIGGHLDSKKTTPGANDDASGVAAVLELARDFAGADVTPTLIFALFGTEEIIDADKSHHHFGSRAYVKKMSAADRQDLVAMISLDMIAYGSTCNLRTMGKGPQTLRDMLRTYAGAHDTAVAYLKDTGPTGWSDHEPFELAGYPAVWIQWLEDPTYHGPGDTYEHCKQGPVRTTGRLIHGFVAGLTEQDLEQLHAAVRQ